ncbi:RNA polymerase subunit sigma-24 [Virgisporangium aliadipatigenens]|uniref:RNA polymerase sigma factor n=1 Tax=Virgisporangium aliadipatigenens TaxID=741659 RepID=A0A8J3YIY6_9ACTN|nr:DUF6596 domain-containing protein [Virgisporangium aliadipatigenens]GIJ45033.1 RNA polymerase subunit sigma-24 [Virgisporangium aliadipatigenens]
MSVHAAVEAVWRIESGRLVAQLARVTGDVGLAEELAQDALVAALEQWPSRGIPDDPGPWLMAVARHKAVDGFRRRATFHRKMAEIGRETPAWVDLDEPDLDDHIGDDLLRLILTACHPAVAVEGQVALVLKTLGGLSTAEIARAFLVPEPTVAQRIVRAKRALRGVEFTVPAPVDRLPAALKIVYLIFNEGYAATAGDDWMRPSLCQEALRLGRLLAGLVPGAAEVHGLVALMELQASRTAARTDADGAPVLLPDQDRRRWDRLLIRRGLASLARAEEISAVGPYTLQAAIAACHARALHPEETDWERIAALYRVLVHVQPSPIVELNRAVAVGMATGPLSGLAVVEPLAASLDGYALFHAVRGDLLERLGRDAEARAAFGRAAALTRNERERALFTARAS